MCVRLFLAPEKVAGENVGVAADIWGVGVLAFILWVFLLVRFNSASSNAFQFCNAFTLGSKAVLRIRAQELLCFGGYAQDVH